MKLAVICDRRPTRAQGVGDSALLLIEEMTRRGHPAGLAASRDSAEAWAVAGHAALPLAAGWDRSGLAESAARLRARGTEAVILEYTPYMYQARGLPLGIAGLPAALSRVGIPTITLMHELYIPWWLPPQVTVAGAVQRLAVRRLMRDSRAVGVSFVGRHRGFLARWPESRWRVLPSPSNLPYPNRTPEVRDGRRADAGAGPDDLLLVLFGSAHRGLPLPPVISALQALNAARVSWRLAIAGPVTDDFMRLAAAVPSVEVRCRPLGYLLDQRLSDLLAAADLGLFGYEDGISSRRSSLAGAWQAGLAVISTDGVNTDPWLRDSGAALLVPAGNPEAFAEGAVRLARDPDLRRQISQRATEVYAKRFDWEVLGDQVEEMLGGAGSPK